jgi:hypothetical protein
MMPVMMVAVMIVGGLRSPTDAGRAAYVYFEDESGRSPAAKLLTVRPADRSEHREAVVDADNLSRAV